VVALVNMTYIGLGICLTCNWYFQLAISASSDILKNHCASRNVIFWSWFFGAFAPSIRLQRFLLKWQIDMPISPENKVTASCHFLYRSGYSAWNSHHEVTSNLHLVSQSSWGLRNFIHAIRLRVMKFGENT
jgi:hypothetical protein